MEEAVVLPRATIPICTSPKWSHGPFAGKLCLSRARVHFSAAAVRFGASADDLTSNSKGCPRLLISTRFDSTAQPSTPSVSPHTFHQNGYPRLHRVIPAHRHIGNLMCTQSSLCTSTALLRSSISTFFSGGLDAIAFTHIYMVCPHPLCHLPCPPVLACHVFLSSATAVGVVIRFAW